MSTCIRILMRSSGAVTVLAAAPATAPAAKSAASLGTQASMASGCFTSWAQVGANSFLRSTLSTTETQAKLQRMPLPPPPVKLSCVVFHNGSSSAASVRAHWEAFRLGMLRQEIMGLDSPVMDWGNFERWERKWRDKAAREVAVLLQRER